MATSSCVISIKLGGSGDGRSGRCSSQTSLNNIYTSKAPHPDRPEDQDCTELNLSKQKYEKDPREALKEIVNHQKGIQNVIQEHITKPFKPVVFKGNSQIRTQSENQEVEAAAGTGEGRNIEVHVVKEKVAAKKKYLIVHFSHYFVMGNVTKKVYFPAEFALAEFSVFNGLGKGVSGLIDIGVPPMGYSHDIRDRQKVTCNPRPPFDDDFDADLDALKRIEDFCRPHFPDGEPILLFTPKEYVPIVADGLRWLFDAAGRTLNMEIMPLSCLLQVLANESQKPEYRPATETQLYHVPHESLLEAVLHSQQYAFSPDLACEYHSKPENEQGVEQCAETMVKRFIFNSSRFLTAFYKVEPRPNIHYPGYKTCKPNVIKKRGGFRIYEMPEGHLRVSNIQHFSSCERINTLLQNRAPSTSSRLSSSQNSLLSSEDSSTSGVNLVEMMHDNNPYESRPSMRSNTGSRSYTSSSSSVGNTTLSSLNDVDPADLVDVPSGWESKTLLKDFRVERDIRYGYSLNSLNEDTVFLPASYTQNANPYEEEFLKNFHLPSKLQHTKMNEERNKQGSFGRGRKIPSKFILGNSEDGLAQPQSPVQIDSCSQDSVSSGMSVSITPRKKARPKYSKLWDTASVKSSSSSVSVATIGSASGKDQIEEMKMKLNLFSDVATAGSPVNGSMSDLSVASGTDASAKVASSSKVSVGSVNLDEGDIWAATKRTGRKYSTSSIPDSASVAGYQVDDLPVSDDEAYQDDDSLSVVALKRLSMHNTDV